MKALIKKNFTVEVTLLITEREFELLKCIASHNVSVPEVLPNKYVEEAKEFLSRLHDSLN